MNILTPSTSTNRPTSEHVLHPKAFQAWRWVFLAALLLATVAITTFYFSSAQAQGADGAIAGLTLTSTTAGTLTVSWDAASPTPTDYRVDWAKSTEDYQSWKVDEGHKYPDPSATTTTITDLSHDTEYKIRMRARYYRGEYEGKSWGGPWAEATITVTGEPAETPTPEPVKEEPVQQPPRDAPDPPAGTIDTLTAADETGQLLLTWTAPAAPNDDPTDYHVNWAKSAEDYPSDTASYGNDHPTDTTLTMTVLEFDTDYNVRVRARYSDGENADSPWNGPWTETTAQVKLPLPAAPFIGAIAVSPDREVLLTWFNSEENNSITGYQVLRGPDTDSLAVIEDDTGSTSTSYTDTAPPAGQTHTYAVKARNASGLSPLSNTLTATVPAAEVLIVARHESASNTLVSNLGQTTTGAGGAIAGPSHGNHYEIATSFTTGTNPFGYHPTSVQLYMNKPVGGDTPTLQVSIRGDNAGLPGETALYSLNTSTEITTSHQPITFTTSDEVALQPNTKYWLYINATGGTVTAQETASDDEDIESNVNWQIGDDRVFKENGGTWTTATASSLRMAIHGHAAPPVLVSNLGSPASGLQFSAQLNQDRRRYAQTFSAANNADGTQAKFDFEGLTFQLSGSDIGNVAASHFVVTVNADNSGEPGSVLYLLTSATTSLSLHNDNRREFTFNAPTGATLTSGVTYWIIFAAAPGSDYFDRDYISLALTQDDGEVQGTETVNHWSIGDTSLYDTGSAISQTEQRVVMVAVLGLQLAAPLVSNLGQTSAAPIQIFDDKGAAQAFVAAPGPFDFGYHFQGIRVSARGFVFSGELLIPQVRASLHGDSGGIPGARLHTLTMPLDFASTENLTDYTLLAPPGTVLRGGARYWVVFEVLINNLYLEATSSADEDQRLEAWSIDNDSYTKQASGWVIRPRVIKLAVLGSPQWVTNEADGPDLPGAGHNAHQTNGVVTPGIVSTGHLTAGLDYDHGHSGDYWWLETQRGHRYRVEVKFGDNPNNDTGGSAWMSFIDPDHHDYPYASGCCEADHNRDDGHTFVHFYRPTDDWNNRYLINVAAFDKLNHNSRIYNGPYTITMTDITGTEKVATNLYLGTRIENTPLPEIDEGVKYAVSFTTGDHSAGYKLDRVRIHVPYHEGQPDLVLHANTSGLPGDGICDLLEPNKVQHHRPYTADNPLPVPFRAAHCGSEAFLDANTTYWLVLEGTDYETVFTDSNDQQTRGSGWTIGDRAATSLVGSWGNLASTWGTIPVEIWANKLNNPLSVSLEVTSDPTHGTDSDTYGAGDVITFEVKFSEAVTIKGTPRLRFKISGTGDDYAPYLSGSGTNTLVFAYTVLATDADTNGIFLYNRPLSYPDADADTIVAVDDNLPVIDKITGQIRTLSGHKIDGTITN